MADTLTNHPLQRIGHLGSVADMRISNNANWINKNTHDCWNEIYDPSFKYDIAIFVKAMDVACQAEAQRIQAYGGKVIFDANVNYYEIWVEYDIPGTRPTPQQQQDAIAMTQLADGVVADSTYLLDITKKYNSNAVWVPDNVDLTTFRGLRRHRARKPIRLIWSGVAKKSQPLLMIKNVLRELNDVELVIVSDAYPQIISELSQALPCHCVPYSNRRYARELRNSDIIISPKNLVNGYEMGHTEYKITLGMAMGLPAVASPQQSYREAIDYKGGGIIAETERDWYDALHRLSRDPDLRSQLGQAAHQTVRERYATPVVAQRYLDVLRNLL